MTTHARTAALAALLAAALGCGGSDDGPEPPRVFFTEPTSTLHVRGGAVVLRIFVDGVPERVDLYKDGAPLVNLGANGRYEYVWSADGAPERVHRFTARAQIDGKREESPPLDVVVDRTPPALVSTQPPEGATRVAPGSPIVLTFGEPLSAASATASVTLRVDGALRTGTLAMGADPRSLEVLVDGAAGVGGEGPVEIELGAGVRDLAGNELIGTPVLGFSLLTWERLGGGPLDTAGLGWRVQLLGAGPTLALSSGTFWTPTAESWLGAFPYDVAGESELDGAVASWDGILALWRRPEGLLVRRFRRDAVEQLPPISLVNAGATATGATIAARGATPIVSWYEWGSEPGVHGPYVRILDGAAWQPAEPAGSDGAFNWFLASGTEPVATWYSPAGTPAAARLEGGEWLPLAPLPTEIAALAVRPNGTPVAVTSSLELLALGTERWQLLGTAAGAPPSYAVRPALATDPWGAVLVGWVEWETGGTAGHLHAVLYDEAAGLRTVARDLQTIGTRPDWLAVAFDDTGAPLLAWRENLDVHVRRLAP